DFDDALHVEVIKDAPKIEDRHYEVGIHIADVSYFVRPGSELNARASTQTTTVYFPHTAWHMLPSELSEEVCSLRPDEEKRAFSVVVKMTGKGEILPGDVWYGRTLIKSVARLDYATAQDVLDGKFDNADENTTQFGGELCKCIKGYAPTVIEGCRAMDVISRALNAQRFARGALSMTSKRLYFGLDEVTAQPLELTEPRDHHVSTHGLIEEFMLLANQLVARRCVASFPTLPVVRKHPCPRTNDYETVCSIAGLPKPSLGNGRAVEKTLKDQSTWLAEHSPLNKQLATETVTQVGD
ncbi:hypothetical protein KIPB_009534, partial [Kipferlia bialata]